MAPGQVVMAKAKMSAMIARVVSVTLVANAASKADSSMRMRSFTIMVVKAFFASP